MPALDKHFIGGWLSGIRTINKLIQHPAGLASSFLKLIGNTRLSTKPVIILKFNGQPVSPAHPVESEPPPSLILPDIPKVE